MKMKGHEFKIAFALLLLLLGFAVGQYQLGPALAASHNGSVILVAFQAAVHNDGCGDEIHVVRNDQPVLHLAGGCFWQPLVALNADGTHALLATPLGPVGGGTRIYESMNGGPWALSQWLEETIVLVQRLRTGYLLLANDTSIHIREHGTWLRRLGPVAAASAEIGFRTCGDQWQLHVGDCMYRSLTEGRNWSPPDCSSASGLVVPHVLYDRHAQPPGFDALAFLDDEGNTHSVEVRAGAHLYRPRSIQRFACGNVLAMHNRYALAGPADFAVSARTCRPTNSTSTTTPLDAESCRPDGTQLGTRVILVPRIQPSALALSPAPTLAVASLLDGHLVMRDASDGEDDFLVDLLFVRTTTTTILAAGIRARAALPRIGDNGYYLAADFSRAIATSVNGQQAWVAYTNEHGRVVVTKLFLR